MRTFARRLLIASVIAAIGVPAWSVTPASSVEGEGIVLRAEPGAEATKDYTTPMIVPDPLGTDDPLTEPGNCAIAHGLAPVRAADHRQHLGRFRTERLCIVGFDVEP